MPSDPPPRQGRTRRQIMLQIGLPLAVLMVVVLIAVGYLSMPPDRSAGGAALADPTDESLVARGAGVYGEHCAVCHGANLEGQTPEWRTRDERGALPAPPHDETGHTWHHPDQQLFIMVKHGMAPFAPEGYVSDMPAYDGILSDRDIIAVLSYIKSTWPPNIQASHTDLTERAARAAMGN